MDTNFLVLGTLPLVVTEPLPLPLAEEGSRIDLFVRWAAESGILGVAGFLGIFILGTMVLLPASRMMVAAGWIWGIGMGYAVVAAGTLVVATLGFLVGRKLGRKRILKHYEGSEKFPMIDEAITKEGAKVIFMLRLAPIFPFGLCNYIYGLSGVRLAPYLIATMLGMLPGTLINLYAGSLLYAGVEKEPDAIWFGIRGLAFVALFGGFWLLGKICRGALRESPVTGEKSGGE